jgi:hypothetical protein
MVAVLRAPHEMCRQSCNCVAAMPVISHQPRLLSRAGSG